MVVPQRAPDVSVSWTNAEPQACRRLVSHCDAASTSKAWLCGKKPMAPSDGQMATGGPSLRNSQCRAGQKKAEPKGGADGRNSGLHHKRSRGSSSQAKLRAKGLCRSGNTEDRTTRGLKPMETSKGPLPAWRSPLRNGSFRAGRKKSETKGDSASRNSQVQLW